MTLAWNAILEATGNRAGTQLIHGGDDCSIPTCVDIPDAHLQAVYVHKQRSGSRLLASRLGLAIQCSRCRELRGNCSRAAVRSQRQAALDPDAAPPANMRLQALDLRQASLFRAPY